jgi:hypothetical protein
MADSLYMIQLDLAQTDKGFKILSRCAFAGIRGWITSIQDPQLKPATQNNLTRFLGIYNIKVIRISYKRQVNISLLLEQNFQLGYGIIRKR